MLRPPHALILGHVPRDAKAKGEFEHTLLARYVLLCPATCSHIAVRVGRHRRRKSNKSPLRERSSTKTRVLLLEADEPDTVQLAKALPAHWSIEREQFYPIPDTPEKIRKPAVD